MAPQRMGRPVPCQPGILSAGAILAPSSKAFGVGTRIFLGLLAGSWYMMWVLLGAILSEEEPAGHPIEGLNCGDGRSRCPVTRRKSLQPASSTSHPPHTHRERAAPVVASCLGYQKSNHQVAP